MAERIVERLHQAIATVCPIDGVSITGPTSARIDYAASATQPQKNAATSTLAAFDWSQAAQDAWLVSQARADAKVLVLGPTTEGRAIKALALLLLQEINRVRTQPTTVFAAYTEQQLLDAFLAKIDVA